MSEDDAKGIVAIIGIVLLVLAMLFSPLACNNNTDAKRVLSEQGYTDIQINGYRYSGGGDDEFNSGFEATSPGGKRVTGVVSKGYWKGNTIRLD